MAKISQKLTYGYDGSYLVYRRAYVFVQLC
jgi:hypothetical protein